LQYFNTNYILKKTIIEKSNSIIYNSILKNGYSNFTLEILEYCEPSETISREQYYLDLLKPEYNILLTAGSPLGYKHNDETKAKMSASKIGNKNATGVKAENGQKEQVVLMYQYKFLIKKQVWKQYILQ
jgi:group I intron endonuclease